VDGDALMTKTKVLYIMHMANNSGSVISLKNLLSQIAKDKIQAVVVYPRMKATKPEVVSELKNLGATVVEGITDLSAIYRDKNIVKRIYHNIKIPFRRIRARKSLDRIIREYQPDIIHTNSGISQMGFLLSRKYNIPHVWHIREYLTKDFNRKLYPNEKTVRELYGQSYTICITKDIQEYFGLAGNARSRVIYNPIFSVDQLSDEISSKKEYFLIASRIGAEKGIDEIIDCFIEAKKESGNFKLLIAGEGREKENYMKKYEEYIREGSVVFLGFVKDVRPLMAEASALFVGSRNEGFGRMTAEANMMGCMVIGRNSAGTKEIITETKGGFLYNDKPELVSIIKQVSHMSGDDMVKFMEAPRKRAIELYSNERSAQEVLAFYNSILSNKTSE